MSGSPSDRSPPLSPALPGGFSVMDFDMGQPTSANSSRDPPSAASSASMAKSASSGGDQETAAGPSRASMAPRPPLPQRRASENALSPHSGSPSANRSPTTGSQSQDYELGTPTMLTQPELPSRTSSRQNLSPRISSSALPLSAAESSHLHMRSSNSSSNSGKRDSGLPSSGNAAAVTSDVQTHSADAGPSRPKSIPTAVQQQHQQQMAALPSSPTSKEIRSSRRDQLCDACGKPMSGQFVRALGVVFHLDCFRCRVSRIIPRSWSRHS